MKIASRVLVWATYWLVAMSTAAQAQDLCEQPSPEEMAKAVGVTLPPRPWHLANLWWDLETPVQNFASLEVDVTIDRDISSDYNLYLAPCGIAEINGLQFYGGIQTNINGWEDRSSQVRVHRGKGGIFSRWSSDKKTPIGLDHVKAPFDDCLMESAGYEGEFASVRRPFAWNKGSYTWCVKKGESENGSTWFTCSIRDREKNTEHEVGSLKFEGTDFTYWARHSAFVEVYATEKIPRSGIPKINVTFSHPRVNGKIPPLKKVSAFYPSKRGPASPDCAWVKPADEGCVVEIGPIFVRDEARRRHDLPMVKE